MIKLFTFILFLLICTGCGLSTNSSNDFKNTFNTSELNSTGVDENNSSLDNNGSTLDNNSSSLDSNSSSLDSNSSNDNLDGVQDDNACTTAQGYNVVSDDNFDPEGFSTENGLNIASLFPLGSESKVTLFYPVLESSLTNNWVIFTKRSEYKLSYNTAWLENSLKDIYIRVPSVTLGQPQVCYRITLDKTSADQLSVTKVFK